MTVPTNNSPRDRSTSFVNPIPGGTIGRTDQGVDISATPGAILIDPVPGTSRLAGIIPNWYGTQPYYWFQVISGPFKGRFWYVAEQIRSSLSKGQTVNQGEPVGTYAPTGTATEWGWSTASGTTLAKATSGYTEGEVTPAGTDFTQRVTGAKDKTMGIPAVPATGSGGAITRPGGQDANAQDTGGGVDTLFANYKSLIDTPRTAPSQFIGSGPIAPFRWWYQSFLGKWSIANTPAQAASQGSGPLAAGAVAATKGDYTPTTWAAALLNAISAPVTPANVNSIVAWEEREGGNWNNTAKYNPLNTTQDASGATPINSAGVRAYTSWTEGLRATVQTLQNGAYADIVAALRKGKGLSGGTYTGLSTWSGGGYSSI